MWEDREEGVVGGAVKCGRGRRRGRWEGLLDVGGLLEVDMVGRESERGC